MSETIDSSPAIPHELFSAYPVGGLTFLAGVASVLCAEHGVDAARDLVATLASADLFWAELRQRLEGAPPADAEPALSAIPKPVAAPTRDEPELRAASKHAGSMMTPPGPTGQATLAPHALVTPVPALAIGPESLPLAAPASSAPVAGKRKRAPRRGGNGAG